jgi:type I restriction enzyme S subunit
LLNDIELIGSFYRGSGIKHPSMAKVLDMKIPVPPITIQREIVDILDKFTQLEAELEAELEARRKQYEHYRNQLLSFDDAGGVRWATLGEIIVSLKTGLNPRKNFILNTSDATNFYVTVRELNGTGITILDKTDKVNDRALGLINNRSNLEVGDILFSGTGTIGRTAMITEPPTNWNIKEGVYTIKPRQDIISSRFLLFFLSSEHATRQYKAKIVGSPVMSVPMSELKKISIPVPSFEEQNRITNILDNFNGLVHDISDGLPAELVARHKQYEYYRNKILTFKEC